MSGLSEKLHTSRSGLARALGFSHAAINKWQKDRPDAPKTLDEGEWRAFIERNELGTAGNRNEPGYNEARTQSLIWQTKLIKIRVAKEQRKLIPADEVDSFLLFLASRIKSGVYQSFCQEAAPKLPGLDVTDIRRMLRESADVLIVSWQTMLDDWAREQDTARKASAAAAQLDDETGAL